MIEIFVTSNKTTGLIEWSGRIDKVLDSKNLDGSTKTEQIESALNNDTTLQVNYLPDQLLPNKLTHKMDSGAIVLLSAEDNAANILIEEADNIELNLKKTTIGMFKMIRAIWETGVSKGVWSASDITDNDLKQQYVNWCAALDRYDEIK